MNGIEKDYVEIIGGDLVPLYMVIPGRRQLRH